MKSFHYALSYVLFPLALLLASTPRRSVTAFTIDAGGRRPAAEALAPYPPARFPTRDTPPVEVLEASLAAMRSGDRDAIYRLLSRARRLSIDNDARRDMRESDPSPERRRAAVGEFFRARGAGRLLGEEQGNDGAVRMPDSRVLSIVGDPFPPKGRLATRLARVRAGGRVFRFTLTRQSEWDGGDPRDHDGFERCWFVWEVQDDEEVPQDESVVEGSNSPNKVLAMA